MIQNKPLIILGNPRSGTSLLRVLINSHDNVVVPPECGFSHFLFEKYKNFKMEMIDLFLDDLFETKKIEGWSLNKKNLSVYLKKQKIKNYFELIEKIYVFYGNQINKKNIEIWGDKNNYFLNHLEDIELIYDKPKYIFIIRNPKDVVSSYIKVNELPESKYKPKFPNSVEEITNRWIDNNNKISLFLKNKNERCLIIFYEDIISDIENSIKKIFNFLNITFTDVEMNFNSKKFFDEPSITMDWKKKLIGEIDSNNINTYLKVLSQEEINLINQIISQNNLLFDFFY
jgi:hypothetical protein